MGSLKPGATYIYEKADGVTYAREFGAEAATRFPIGWDYQTKPITNKVSTIFGAPATEVMTYIEMLEAAKSNPALHEALERAKVIYHLGKKDGQE